MQLTPKPTPNRGPARRLPPSPARSRSDAAGFTLIEILVTVAIVAVGLLGLAKLQAAAISETQTSRTRSVITMQAESLANAMRSDRAFWASTTSLPSFTIAAGGTVTYGGAFPAAHAGGCTSPSTACSSGEMARDDVSFWATGFGSQFPTATGSMSCSTASSTGPTTCDLSLTWTENIIAINRSAGAASGSTAAHSNTNYLVLHIQP